MVVNMMGQVAKMLGVELEEEFEIIPTVNNNRYRLTKDGLQFKLTYGWVPSNMLEHILRGEYSIKKIPWRAEEGQIFYIPVLRGCERYQCLVAEEGIGEGYYKNGLMCKTQEQATQLADLAIKAIKEFHGMGEDNNVIYG